MRPLLLPPHGAAVSDCWQNIASCDFCLAGLGVLAPRISPLVAMVRKPPVTRQARMLYGLTILAPRATALVGMLQSFSKMAAVVR
jgi:hypothetical protein